MNVCYIALGSNQKFPERQIRQAIEAIKKLPSTSVLSVSKIYKTKAWGIQVQQDFYNAVVELATLLTPSLLLSLCQKIETNQGRIRKKHWGPRTLDVDIILYGNRTIKTNILTIPHPYMMFRDFVLTPLLEINPRIHLPS
jgi:2-amino-4-hydroxy-6-hydroxymethyldihydropteridine diphosphokinase